ncbi:mitochondrial F1F0 ATP synthase associated protein [Volvox carteri f. nagariensis]|uniref:Mitochondrial F1F0 ATP synthase associated protein n=1 Tax=Volvox carteri f. nagariensis TaxID=3068 RepID=D8TZD9_VOLCA|nr:mitochondrial F1F0 ATP synthase associated protein [Volvox carteri f. nagariensis]EFJ47258.1 mitochondrial F1F0 ATP synthase associated protein [Volvox carteri f. nagariensis]|eukprot:XP_002951807.1 mitochondrial F1F0 ATP synthase associated protein [Volvox carteri f. nagariensis]
MMSLRAAARKQELPSLLLAQARQYVTPLRVEFSEGLAATKNKESTALVEEWKSKKEATEGILKLLQSYKDLGDSKGEPLLKFHNPRTYEDLTAPVPNFRAQNLKPGEVGKFFDNVLQKRAGDAVDAKSKWWSERKAAAEAAAASKQLDSFGSLPVPSWTLGKSVSLESVNKVTDAYLKSLEPARKVTLPGGAKEEPVVVDGGKPVSGFKFVSKAVAAKVLAARRAEVHDRYVKMWAKKLLVSPEVAAVPLKDVDGQLASKFELLAPQYADLLQAASSGSKTLAERMSHHPALDSFLLKREKEAIKGDFPSSEVEAAGAALAKELEGDPAVALEKLLGPELQSGPLAGKPMSEVIAAITAHKYASDRYMYREGMKLAARYKAEEDAMRGELKALYGDNVDVASFQAQPRTPAQQILDRMKELEARAAEFKAELEAADNDYLRYAASKKQQVLSDPSNIAFDEVLYPSLVEEQMDIELAELKEEEMKVDDAEEEELWMLTLSAQFRHIQKHFGVDLPHSVLAHMDPVLVKKIDWETTNGLEDWDITLDDMGAETAKEQWGVENLSHHFLPLIRYRRDKARKQVGRFDPELVAGR